MSAVPVTQDALFDSYAAELMVAQAGRLNLLLEGPAAATDAAVLRLRPYLREPCVSTCSEAPLELPEAAKGALILRNVAALTAGEQGQLLAWLQGAGMRAQVISTTEQALFALVTQGLFDATLYYHLNVLLLYVGPGGRPHRTSQG
jgi:hypothetical protein